MTAHRIRLRTTPETYARASLLHDGARLPLPTVADALGVDEAVAARMVALGRLGSADRVIVVPPGCGPHLGALVIRTPAALWHLDTCTTCQGLDVIMLDGIAASRARWTIGADHRDPPVERTAAQPAATPPPIPQPLPQPAPTLQPTPTPQPVPVPPPVHARAASTLVPPPPARPSTPWPAPVRAASPPATVHDGSRRSHGWPDPTEPVVRALAQQVRAADPDAGAVDSALRTTLASPALPRVTLAG